LISFDFSSGAASTQSSDFISAAFSGRRGSIYPLHARVHGKWQDERKKRYSSSSRSAYIWWMLQSSNRDQGMKDPGRHRRPSKPQRIQLRILSSNAQHPLRAPQAAPTSIPGSSAGI